MTSTQRRRARVAAGRCAFCNEPLGVYRYLCDDCEAKHRERQRGSKVFGQRAGKPPRAKPQPSIEPAPEPDRFAAVVHRGPVADAGKLTRHERRRLAEARAQITSAAS